MISVSLIFLIFPVVTVANGGLEDSYTGLSKSEVRILRAENAVGKCAVSDGTFQSCDELIHDQAVYTGSASEAVYSFEQNYNYWAVVGMRSDPGSDWDLSIYSDTCAAGEELAWSWSYEDTLEFVVVDYNHTPLGWEGIWVGRWSGSGGATVEYEDSSGALVVGANPGLVWPAGDVVEIWDVFLNAGEYEFTLETSSGTADLGLALFESPGGEYYAGRWEADAISDFEGPGGSESLVHDLVQDDWVGIVVWANDGNGATFGINIVSTGIGDEPKADQIIPKAFALNQNYPNPFNPSTTISFDLPGTAGAKQQVSLTVHDVRGRLVRTLLDTQVGPGDHNVHWDGRNDSGVPVSSGIYLYTLKAGEDVSTRKMMIMK